VIGFQSDSFCRFSPPSLRRNKDPVVAQGLFLVWSWASQLALLPCPRLHFFSAFFRGRYLMPDGVSFRFLRDWCEGVSHFSPKKASPTRPTSLVSPFRIGSATPACSATLLVENHLGFFRKEVLAPRLLHPFFSFLLRFKAAAFSKRTPPSDGSAYLLPAARDTVFCCVPSRIHRKVLVFFWTPLHEWIPIVLPGPHSSCPFSPSTCYGWSTLAKISLLLHWFFTLAPTSFCAFFPASYRSFNQKRIDEMPDKYALHFLGGFSSKILVP